MRKRDASCMRDCIWIRRVENGDMRDMNKPHATSVRDEIWKTNLEDGANGGRRRHSVYSVRRRMWKTSGEGMGKEIRATGAQSFQREIRNVEK